MYKTKRIISIIVVIVLGFILQDIFGWNVGEIQANNREETEARSFLLNVYTWVEYIAPEIISDFEKEFHVKVHVDYYDLEDEMFSIVQSKPGMYDLVFPSESSMDIMINSHLLLKLDKRHIPNEKNLKARFRTIINKNWKGYCIPIDWGVTGIAYNTKYVKEPVDSWCIFWNPKYKGHTALVDDPFEVFSVGQKRLGYFLNPKDCNELDEVLKILKELKPLLHDECFMAYNKIKEKLKNEELWIAQCYNGDAALLNEENNNIKFVVPKEGTSFWIDTIAIPAGAKNKRLAEEFINYLLRPDIAAKQTNYSYYASCNKKAWAFVDRQLLRNSYIFIDRKEINRLELYEVLNPEIQRKFNECWADLVKY
ncbi:MAG: spermidine/putrescine ABC transporter substrate-binding protein [Candidatus Brocadiales bacterium]|nr:spermidine/putrescine ABC transporter substrate-binding protein [Candidatus Brocadiales bacterium]